MIEAEAAPIVFVPKGGKFKRRRKFKMQWANDVVKRKIDWLWKGYIAKGGLTLITGDPQAGKSTFICDLVAALTRARPLPGEPADHGRDPLKCWILSSEDDAGTTISWRLENQGADMSKVLLTDEKVLMDSLALADFEEIITEEGFALVVIDTLTTWMGGDVDMNSANQTMGWLSPLKEIAQRTGCSIVLVRHRRKGSAGENKLHAGLGSIGFTAAVRSELFVTLRKDLMRVVEKAKGNIGKPPPKHLYTIEPHPDEDNEHGVLTWTGQTEASDYVEQKGGFKPKGQAKAAAFLLEILADGAMKTKDVVRLGAERRITEATIERARKDTVVAFQKDGEWWMELPTPSSPPQ